MEIKFHNLKDFMSELENNAGTLIDKSYNGDRITFIINQWIDENRSYPLKILQELGIFLGYESVPNEFNRFPYRSILGYSNIALLSDNQYVDKEIIKREITKNATDIIHSCQFCICNVLIDSLTRGYKISDKNIPLPNRQYESSNSTDLTSDALFNAVCKIQYPCKKIITGPYEAFIDLFSMGRVYTLRFSVN